MANSSTATAEDVVRAHGLSGTYVDAPSRSSSAISWGAIAAGAAAAASLSLILLILGVGLGLSSVSPWAGEGVSATTFGVSTIVWLTLTQLVASGVGGYLAGRLRMRWTEVQSDEVYFRDTAHGFLAWAVASLATAALLTSAIGSILGGAAQSGAVMVGGVAGTASSALESASDSARKARGDDGGPMGYFIDSLFRRDTTVPGLTSGVGAAAIGTAADVGTSRNEAAIVSRIFMNVSGADPLPDDDIRYVGQIVAQRTGLSQTDAEKRVVDVYAKAQTRLRNAEEVARDVADKTRKASAYSALWLFVSLLVGAFVASFAATFGGRQRDA